MRLTCCSLLLITALLAPGCTGEGAGGTDSDAEPGESQSTTDAPETSSTSDTAGSTGDSLTPLCDGSQDLRLAWTLDGGGLIRADFEREVGFYYLYVRGDCHYWLLPYAKPHEVPAFETLTGALDEAAEQALMERVQYGAWDELAGCWPEPGGADVSTTIVHDGHSEGMVVCVGECPAAPDPVRALSNSMRDAFAELALSAAPLDDAPMRVLATPALPEQASATAIAWTVALDLAAVAVPEDDFVHQGMSTLIDDPTTAAALRAFRLEHGDAMADFFEFYVETPGGDFYEVYVRDALPFEDAAGLIPRPGVIGC